MTERQIVVPGEAIVKGDDYLPGEGTEKKGDEKHEKRLFPQGTCADPDQVLDQQPIPPGNCMGDRGWRGRLHQQPVCLSETDRPCR